LPIRHLVLATNANNILTRFVNAGDYSIGTVHPTLSPSMDIQVASNFERYLYYLYGQDPLRVRGAFTEFSRSGRLAFSAAERRQVAAEFRSQSVDDAAIIDEIRTFHAATGYVLDPHTAVGVRAGRNLSSAGVPMICLATAHPAKFPTPSSRPSAATRPPAVPRRARAAPRRCESIDADTGQIKEYVTRHAL